MDFCNQAAFQLVKAKKPKQAGEAFAVFGLDSAKCEKMVDEMANVGAAEEVEFIDDDATLAWIDKHSHSTNEHILLLSRLPHRRLLEHIDINAVEAYWLTERVTDGSVRPNLDEILDLIKH